MTGDTGSTSSTQAKKATSLTPDQVAVRQLVTISPEPRTAQELADRYDGLRTENMWPKQSKSSVKQRIDELIEKRILDTGEDAPDGEPTIILAD